MHHIVIFIIKFFVNYYIVIKKILSFPGVILDAFVTEKVVNHLGLSIHKVKYLNLSDKPPVSFDIPNDYKSSLLVSFLPFAILSNIAICIFIYLLSSLGTYPGNQSTDFYLLFWLGISIGGNSLPYTEVTENLWNQSIEQLKASNYFAFLTFPVLFLVRVARALSFFWVDFLYAYLLYLFVLKTL